MKRQDCKHTEGLNNGLPLSVDCHDCDYVDARNRLIPQAEKIAYEVASSRHDQETDEVRYGHAWSRAFHAAMSKLARECGLTQV